MSETFETFTCASCGEGRVKPLAARGRVMLYRNFPALSLPDDLLIPTCPKCGEQWLDDETLYKLDTALKQSAREARSSISRQCISFLSEVVNQRELEALLDLSPGYLSKVKHGQEAPSAPLTALLGLLATRPNRLREVERLWAGRRLTVRTPTSASITGFDNAPAEIPEIAEAG